MTFPHFDGFRVVRELGAGALSTVYEAIQEPLNRPVAIKLLKPTIGPTSPFAAQFEREAQILAELSHPSIVNLLALVKSDRRIYLVLEYVDGFSLGAIFAKRVKVAPEVVASIGATVALGLAHVHERGVVHRDIKPGNVLVSRRGDVKLIDFGIASRRPRPHEPPELEEDMAFGTPAYMSPEQILGEVVDARSDLFSLGVVLYQLLSGARPFERGDDKDRRVAAQRIRRDPPVPLHRRAPEVPRDLERIVMRSLEKLPMDRYATAIALAEHLEAFVERRVGRVPIQRLAASALAHAGLIPGESSVALLELPRARPSIRPTLYGLVVLSALASGGGAVIQWTGHGSGHWVPAGLRPMALVPVPAGALRVLAVPWAEVWVDGQRVEVTPFAHPIPLTVGTHYITLKHPNAPDETRTLAVAAGETVLLDVEMRVDNAAGPVQGPLDAGPENDGRESVSGD